MMAFQGIAVADVAPAMLASYDQSSARDAGMSGMEAPMLRRDVYTAGQYDIIYNVFSLAIACMGSATVYLFFHFSLVDRAYKNAVVIGGLVTLIAFYHYMRIFESFTGAYVLKNGVVHSTGVPFNDAYRYVDWILTVPLLLTELILVMDLPQQQSSSRCLQLGVAAAIMVALGYPGEISDDSSTRWLFWGLAMVPFLFIVYSLFVGLSAAFANQPGNVRGMVNLARWLTVVSWCTYPVVYIFPMIGFTGSLAHTAIQVGYSVADIVAKPVLGLIVVQISLGKGKDDMH